MQGCSPSYYPSPFREQEYQANLLRFQVLANARTHMQCAQKYATCRRKQSNIFLRWGFVPSRENFEIFQTLHSTPILKVKLHPLVHSAAKILATLTFVYPISRLSGQQARRQDFTLGAQQAATVHFFRQKVDDKKSTTFFSRCPQNLSSRGAHSSGSPLIIVCFIE